MKMVLFPCLISSLLLFGGCGKKKIKEARKSEIVQTTTLSPKLAKKESKKARTKVGLSNPDIKFPVATSASRKLLDKIVARVNGANLSLSDLTQPRIDRNGEAFVSKDVIDQKLDGLYRKGLQEAIDDQLLFYKAAERKMLPTDIDVEKQIVAFKSSQNLGKMPEEEFDRYLRTAGLSARQYRMQLARALAINNVKQAEMSERLVVTSQEAEGYYRLHKEYQEEQYTLKTASFSNAQLSSIVVPTKKQLLERPDVQWEQQLPIARSKMASHLAVVFTMAEGEVAGPLKTPMGYQIVTLVKRDEGRFKTLDEQYPEIEKHLQEQKRTRFEKEFLAELRAHATILYF